MIPSSSFFRSLSNASTTWGSFFFSHLHRERSYTLWRSRLPTPAPPLTTSRTWMKGAATSSRDAFSRSSSFRRGRLPPLPTLFFFCPTGPATASHCRTPSVFASSLPFPSSTERKPMPSFPPGASPVSEGVVPRGRRRKNFADEDELREWQRQQSFTTSTVTPSSSFSSQREDAKYAASLPFSLSSPSSSPATSTAISSPYASSTSFFSSSFRFPSFVSSHPSWCVRWWIRSMWVPYVGAVAAKCCEWSSWVLYVGGKIVFYCRTSPVASLPASDTTATPTTCSGSRVSPHPMENVAIPGLSGTTPTSSPLDPPEDAFASFPYSHSTWEAMRGKMQHTNALYVGRSAIHGRGIFSAIALPRGTRLPLSGWWSPPSSSATTSSPPVFHALPRCFLPGPSHTLLFSDTYERLPDTLHYSHPTGKLLEVLFSQGDTTLSSGSSLSPTQTSPEAGGHCLSHVFLNHSCEASVCSGLSKCFWAAALAADHCVRHAVPKNSVPPPFFHTPANRKTPDTGSSSPSSPFAFPLSWSTKMCEFSGFDDPNAFFTTRDIRPHEELTIDYGCRVAPLYAPRHRRHGRRWQKNGVCRSRASCSSSVGMSTTPFTLCRCGSPSCRYRLYQPPPLLPHEWRSSVRDLLLHPSPFPFRGTPPFCDAFASQLPRQEMPPQDGEARMGRLPNWTPTEDFCTAVELFARGYDDECTLLSLLPTSTSLLEYLSGKTLSALHCPFLWPVAPPPPTLVKAKYSKSEFFMSYRYLFQGLNTVVPKNVE